MQLVQQFLVWPGIDWDWLLLKLVFHSQSRVEVKLWKMCSNLALDISLMMLTLLVCHFALAFFVNVV